MPFAAIHIPDFRVQAVMRVEPNLRDLAVALLDGAPPLCKVVAVNAPARGAGVHVGMSKSQVEQYGGVEIRQRTPSLEKSAHAALLDVGWSVSPRVEDTADHTIVLDIAGLSAVFGSEQEIAEQILEKTCRLGLAASIAVATNIEAAILAARGFSGVTLILEGEEAARLGKLPVQALTASEDTFSTLEQWGLRNCAALAALPVADLSERLGQEGVRLHALARGASTRALLLAEPAVSFEEEMALDDPVEDIEPLAFILGRLLDQLCARVSARALALQSVHARFELDTQRDDPSINSALTQKKFARVKKSHTRKKTVAHASAANGAPDLNGNNTEVAQARFHERTLELPLPLRDSKMLLKLLRLQLQAEPPQAPVKKVLLAGEAAAPRTTQKELFLPSSPDPAKLELTIARIAHLVGGENIGAAQIVDTHRPGAFRMSRFSVVTAETRKKKKLERAPQQPSQTTAIFRAFRPPVPAQVTLCTEQPSKILFQGLQGYVLHASGPWRTSGDWWRDDAWYHDEWDLEVSFDSGASRSLSAPMHIDMRNSPRDQNGRPGLAPRLQETEIANHRRAVYRVHFDRVHEDWFVLGVYD